ncbi:MAG TPA: peptidoglycan editing factor PgeF [Cytophagales bacterium]|nr:peptidoglycan editing factor PgeF [Cytophagales bacterium]
MHRTVLGTLPVYKFDTLGRISNINHFVTTRDVGNKASAMGGFNLSFKVNDDPEQVQENRNVLAKNLGIATECLFIPDQTHSSHVRIINSVQDQQSLADTDALITSRKGLCIAVLAADCVPILIYDYKNQVAAAIHAGWKGTIGHIVEKTVQTMHDKLGAEPINMIACIGPSICEKVYEVGNEVADAFNGFGHEAQSKIVLPHVNAQKKFLNLQYANKYELMKLGIKEDNIEVSTLCTFTNNHLFYSARFFKNNCGRFASGIILK